MEWPDGFDGKFGSPITRIARYYDLTAAGRRGLNDEIARWRSYTGAMDLVIEGR